MLITRPVVTSAKRRSNGDLLQQDLGVATGPRGVHAEAKDVPSDICAIDPWVASVSENIQPWARHWRLPSVIRRKLELGYAAGGQTNCHDMDSASGPVALSKAGRSMRDPPRLVARDKRALGTAGTLSLQVTSSFGPAQLRPRDTFGRQQVRTIPMFT